MFVSIPEVKLSSFTKLIKKSKGILDYKIISNEVKKVEVITFYEGKELKDLQTMQVYGIEVTGEEKLDLLNGYKFIAKVEFIDAMEKPIITCLNDSYLPAILKNHTTKSCDHCNTNRQRKQIFVIENKENNQLLQIGHSCLREYFPNVSVEALQACQQVFTVLKDIDLLLNEPTTKNPIEIIDVCEIIALARKAINNYGYVSQNNADTMQLSTSDIVKSQYYGNPVIKLSIDENDVIEAKALLADNLAKLNEYFEENNNVFNYNLKNFIESGYVTLSKAGFITYLPVLINKLNAVKNENSAHIGTVKEKVKLPVTLVSKSSFEGAYGVTTIYTFNHNGNVLTWFNTGNQLDCNINDSFTLQGTVKQHNIFKGVKQTVLTRCKIV